VAALRRLGRGVVSAARAGGARLMAPLAGLLGGVMSSTPVAALTLPEDTAEVMYHLFNGADLTAQGPALLVRKSLFDKVSVTGTYYVDMISSASIDVVTTASPFKETRREYNIGAEYVYRDSLLSASYSNSNEPDYKAQAVNIDASQEVFGNMTTITLGFSRGQDDVGKTGEGFFDYAKHWRYRFGVTQVVTPSWLASLNFEAGADDGYLGSPYRSALVFGAYVPENVPRTRSSRSIKLGVVGQVMERTSLNASYRYFYDTWDIKASTFQIGGSRYVGESFLIDGYVRYYTQTRALFYSNDATTETVYITRNRQHSTFYDVAPGVRVTYVYKQVPGRYEIKGHLNYEYQYYKYADFTDVRTGQLYSYSAHLLQLVLTATF
jgi:hypothetical protein